MKILPLKTGTDMSDIVILHCESFSKVFALLSLI